MNHILHRLAFITNRALEFFTEKELTIQIGGPRALWALLLVKELIDNSLDACEKAGIAPAIVVTVDTDLVTVTDNGPGLPATTLRQSLDYLVRVSDKAYYVSPTRGQLGNALKCVWAAPFVMTGAKSVVEITTLGQRHRITVQLDRIAQQPLIELTTEDAPDVKNGTSVTLHWPQIASYLLRANVQFSYMQQLTLPSLLRTVSGLNPHLDLTYHDCTHDHHVHVNRSVESYEKWTPQRPTSPHWYTPELLSTLVAAYISDERATGQRRTVRELVAEFAGLSATTKQKAVTDAVHLTGLPLEALIVADDINDQKVGELLMAMQQAARPIQPAALGMLGEEQLSNYLVYQHGIAPASVRYKRVEGTAEGVPYSFEVAFGVDDGSQSHRPATLVTGINWSPMMQRLPFAELPGYLTAARIDAHDPVVCVIHFICPRVAYTDRGKVTATLYGDMPEALQRCIKAVTKEWTQAKRHADRQQQVRNRDLDQIRKQQHSKTYSIKEAAYARMEQAYLKASANGTLPANARQVMYAARPLVLALTGGTCWKDSSYFTQHLLPDFIEAFPELTAQWDVVYDAHGGIIEPHTAYTTDLGTLHVRRYIQDWQDQISDTIDMLTLATATPTRGPSFRYRSVLFVEKEGFNELLRQARIAEQYDMAIMSTKGMSVTAARTLIESLSQQEVTIFVLHDFDKSGFSIVHTLRSDTRRYTYQAAPRVIDLGLRLHDVESLQLASEQVNYDGKIDPRTNLRESSATEEECMFLVRSTQAPWTGERVELNAMDSAQFIAWLRQQLDRHGAQKYIPRADDLARAYRHARMIATLQATIDTVLATSQSDDMVIPDTLAEQVAQRIVDTDIAWDQALADLVKESL